MNTKVIALLNEKGGVGKSSSAAAIAYLLAKQGKKTAVIDFDGKGLAKPRPCTYPLSSAV